MCLDRSRQGAVDLDRDAAVNELNRQHQQSLPGLGADEDALDVGQRTVHDAHALAFARGLHLYLPRQLRREWKPEAGESSGVLHLPETTALALLGLAGRGPSELRAPLQVANHWLGETRSSLAKAWLTIALRNHGLPVPDPSETTSTGPDVMLTALEALGHSQGNHRLLAAGKTA